MNKYEMMFIVKATMDSENVKKVAESLKNLVTELKGNLIDYKELGEKKLAYPIKKQLSGYYFLMHFEGNKEIEAEINRKARLDENIIRHLIIRLDEE